ncbi:hypothetical protein OVA14_03165 [Agrococcus sp. SL85]|uniref:hypothetical protein n=1 Tax=Agrococcus sp. SL85 TaxID=2995141 RepID=UPI00226D38A6|nr:hypothetical protein [Agrococcus sp. SL85]WAC66786.1 hypothetical protein OVA14_03165 [Agrococcus sp. SL85]
MDTIWLLIIAPLVILAIAATLGALVGEQAPRVPVDPWLLRGLRDRHEVAELDRAERERARAILEAQLEHELDARGNGLVPVALQPRIAPPARRTRTA